MLTSCMWASVPVESKAGPHLYHHLLLMMSKVCKLKHWCTVWKLRSHLQVMCHSKAGVGNVWNSSYLWGVISKEATLLHPPLPVFALACILFHLLSLLKEKFGFLHIWPYTKDIYNHWQCSTALLWQTVQSWKLELVADVTASWKQQRCIGTLTVCQNTQ